jgi:hypothetical protein
MSKHKPRKTKKTDKIGVTFEVRNNIRQLDGVPMPQPVADGWYWSYDHPKAFSLCHGPFKDCIAAELNMHFAMFAKSFGVTENGPIT